jgi:hypothetical protein
VQGPTKAPAPAPEEATSIQSDEVLAAPAPAPAASESRRRSMLEETAAPAPAPLDAPTTVMAAKDAPALAPVAHSMVILPLTTPGGS